MHPGRLACSALVFFFAMTVSARGAQSCDPIQTFADGKAPLREIFVAASGSISDGDGSRAQPFQTVARALQGVRAGDAVRLLPGEYHGGISVTGISGAPDAPIWIGGVPGEPRPVIRGGSGGLLMSRVRYLVVENIEVAEATGNGINCDDGADYASTNATRSLVFRNLFIHDIGTGKNNDGLKLSGVNDFHVLDCEFARISVNGSAIDHVGCHNGLIARSSFTDCGNGVQCKGGSENIEIRWCSFARAGGRAINIGGSTGFAFFRPPLATNAPNFEAKNIRVLASTFVGSDAAVAFVGAVDSLVANNTIIEPARWVIRILQETASRDGFEFLPCGHNEFANNLVWHRRAAISTHVNVGGNTDAPSFKFANNLWYAHDQPAHSQPSLPVPEVDGVAGQTPQFADVAGRDYRLAAGSPAAAKGKPIPGLKADHAERCYATPPSIGAFEMAPVRKTAIAIQGDQFFINGQPTYQGRTWRGKKIEGLLMNSRMVQGIFDDLNPETTNRWAYPDTKIWDADRNTREFIAAMPVWRKHGLLCAVVTLQGGSPEGYSAQQPWHNSAIAADGSLRPDYMARLQKIIDRADDLGMAIMLGIFYFGQDQRLQDEAAVKRAVVETVNWVADRGYKNVLIEIANECDNRSYDHGIIKAPRMQELIQLAQRQSRQRNHPLAVSASFNGGSIPTANVVSVADYILFHGNGVKEPARMVEMIRSIRAMKEFSAKPLVNNEDDRPWLDAHQGFGPEGNNFVACVDNYASWGYFDFRQKDESFNEGYQSVPVNWGLSSARKRAYFKLLAEITGSTPD